jgi:nucleotidyltransferase substrate binding protein (TIGR01987 family)
MPGAKMTKREIIKKVTQIILKHARPERIYLYGSQATGDATPTSDIDIAFLDENFKDTYLIKEEVEQLSTLLKIDVTNLIHTEERFKKRVMAAGKVLYSANKKLRAEDGLLNFSRALERFVYIVDRQKKFYAEGDDDIYLDLVVKRFEFTFEMSWKAIKRYLDFTGIGCLNPRGCFKEAFSQGLIDEENTWLDMIEMRDLSTNIYDGDEIKEILDRLESYKKAFTKLKQNIESHLQGEVS